MVSPANINGLLKEHGFDETFDLLSIDIDGNDYWVWEAIEASPRVVVMEYNPTLGPERAVNIPYTEGVEYSEYFRGGVYHGASLAALAKLGERKGYALVGCESTGANACFVREDAAGSLRRLSAAEAWRPSVTRARLGSIDEQQALIADLPMQEV